MDERRDVGSLEIMLSKQKEVEGESLKSYAGKRTKLCKD